MSTFGWAEEAAQTQSGLLTVRAQALTTDNNGTLRYGTFFPRASVPSTSLQEITKLDFRPAASRRGWNQNGRRIPLKVPDKRNLEIEPIEANFRIGEREIQKLIERLGANDEIMRREMMVSIPERSDVLVRAVYNRLELDCFQAWYDGKITVKDPETGETYDMDYQFDSDRMQTAGTAWDSNSVNAYDEFVAWLEDAIQLVGGIQGVVLRRALMKRIQADAPTLAGGAEMTLEQLATRISQDLATSFSFFPLEETIDEFTDGGVVTSRIKVWNSISKVAVVPSGSSVIGSAAWAPVARAVTLAAQLPDAKIDINGVSVFMNSGNNGRELIVEAQANILPVPDEGRVAVMDSGISS